MKDEAIVVKTLPAGGHSASEELDRFEKWNSENKQSKSDWLDGYDTGVQRCMEILEDYKEKHFNNRKTHPINYGTLLDLEMAFYRLMQIESK